MSLIRDYDLVANFCEGFTPASTNPTTYTRRPDLGAARFPNKAVPIKARAWRILPLGGARASTYNSTTQVIARTASPLTVMKSMCAPPGYPIWVQCDSGLPFMVTGPEWQRQPCDTLTILPWGDGFLTSPNLLWSANYKVQVASSLDVLSDGGAPHYWPRRQESVLIQNEFAAAAPATSSSGWPVWPHYKAVRLMFSDPTQQLERWSFIAETWYDGGPVNAAGLSSACVFDESIIIGGGNSRSSVLDAPQLAYYQVNDNLFTIVGYEL